MDGTTTAGRTVQVRRYRIVRDELEPFVAWWRERLVPARLAHGFQVDFAYAIPENDEFLWAVSVPGDAEDFRRIDEAYAISPERAAAFEDVPQRIDTATITLATPVAP
jgi:hypothetical protein